MDKKFVDWNIKVVTTQYWEILKVWINLDKLENKTWWLNFDILTNKDWKKYMAYDTYNKEEKETKIESLADDSLPF